MDIAAEPPMQRPDVPVMHGRRIDWTPRDVFFGVLWFLFLFLLAPLPFVLPFSQAADDPSNSSTVFAVGLVTSMFSQVGLVVVASVFTWRKYGGSWERLGFLRPTWGTLGWAAAALLGAFIWSAAYGSIVEIFDINRLKAACDEQVPATVQDSVPLLLLASFVFVTFAPVCEETFFRAFAFPGLSRWGVPIAMLISAGLWSLAHGSIKAIVPVLGIGIIFALAYFKSGNIWSSILAHFAYNCISVSTLWAGECQPS